MVRLEKISTNVNALRDDVVDCMARSELIKGSPATFTALPKTPGATLRFISTSPIMMVTKVDEHITEIVTQSGSRYRITDNYENENCSTVETQEVAP